MNKGRELKRWSVKAVITGEGNRLTKNNIWRTSVEEIEELQEWVEKLPDWNLLDVIEIRYTRKGALPEGEVA